MTKLFCIISFPLISWSAWASGTHLVGNGGDVVICPFYTNPVLLDFHEIQLETLGSVLIDDTFFKLNPTKSETELTMLMIRRIGELNRELETVLTNYFWEFYLEVYFSLSFAVAVDDEELFYKENTCLIKQIAIQKKPHLVLKKRYVIDLFLWKRLDKPNKAGLILHEILYRVLIEKSKTDEKLQSNHVRQIVGLAATDKLTDFFDKDSFAKFLKRNLKFK